MIRKALLVLSEKFLPAFVRLMTSKGSIIRLERTAAHPRRTRLPQARAVVGAILMCMAVANHLVLGEARAHGGQAPPGSETLKFENLEGIILVQARLSGVPRDTSGLLALDTGAGFLALDIVVAERLGLVEDVFVPGSAEFADRGLARLELGGIQVDQVSPVLVLDASVVRNVTDRPVLGLLGERALAGRALFIDYQAQLLTLVPTPRSAADEKRGSQNPSSSSSRAVFGGLLGRAARPVPFRLAGDGKILVRALVSDPRSPRASDTLTLIVDTGATKCVFFKEAVRVPSWKKWPAVGGLAAPTLFGVSEARIMKVPVIDLPSPSGAVRRQGVDVAVIESPLSGALSRAIGEPVDGLLGYSFLRRYRVGIDYLHGLLWLDPVPGRWDDRPYEYSHVGIQIERHGDAAEVVGVVGGSPAARAGIAIGDTLIAVNGKQAAEHDLLSLTRELEGPPGTSLEVTVRRGSHQRRLILVRRRLL